MTRPAASLSSNGLAERGEPPAEGKGLAFKVPIKADMRSEPTLLFVETLAAALDYIARKPSAES